MPCEMHLSSLVVHARPEELAGIVTKAEDLGCEIHLTSPEGKIVVTYETNDSRALGDMISRLQRIEGVLAATMVYHHSEPAEDGDTA